MARRHGPPGPIEGRWNVAREKSAPRLPAPGSVQYQTLLDRLERDEKIMRWVAAQQNALKKRASTVRPVGPGPWDAKESL